MAIVCVTMAIFQTAKSIQNGIVMENRAMTGIFQSSPKCVYGITSYNQVIYKYVILSYYTSMYRKKTEADNGLVIFGGSTFKF